MLTNGQKIGDRYEIIKSIGEGGMANVYLAKDTILDRKVAIKVLRGDLSSDDKFIRRFQREALSVSNLSHPNIVEVYDVGEENNQHYIVMEYIDGKTLKQLLNKRGSLTLTEVIDIMSQLTEGIAHAHDAYIIHRDIKPQNIMIEDDGLIKITDFGIAMALNSTQLTQTNSVMGSVHYLPPEQANGKGATIKSDIYSLGIMMYELLTGNVPFKGENAVEIALKHLKDKIPSIRRQNPTIPQSVENIIIRATAKNPKNRYESAKEMNKDLKECLLEEHKDDKKYIYSFPEVDFDDTKIITTPKKETIDKPKDIDILKEEQKLDEKIEKYEEIQKKEKLKLPVVLASILLALLIISGTIVILLGKTEVKDIKVPNVVNLTLEEAILKLEEVGFNYTTESDNSEKIEKGKVIKTKPASGSTRKEGSTIIIVESLGSKLIRLEDYKGEKYQEVKAKLELLGINVLVEKKAVDDVTKYEGKEDIVIDQDPSLNDENSEQIMLEKGDEITLYIPDVSETYPDMVKEKWKLSEAEAFAKEYGITLDIEKVESEEEENTILYQSRGVGDRIVKGITLRIKIAVPKKIPDSNQEENNKPNDNKQENKKPDNNTE